MRSLSRFKQLNCDQVNLWYGSSYKHAGETRNQSLPTNSHSVIHHSENNQCTQESWQVE